MIQKKNTKKGFSLVEVLMALTILTMGLTSISVLMIGNIRNSEDARDQVIASQLAEEGLELMRNLKDNKQLDSPPYDKCLIAGGCSFAGLTVDPTVPLAAMLGSSGNGLLYLNAANVYNRTGVKATKFYRTISLLVKGDGTISPSTREISVESEVFWGSTTPPEAWTPVSTCSVANKCVSVISKMPDLN